MAAAYAALRGRWRLEAYAPRLRRRYTRSDVIKWWYVVHT